jgi:hypothetical protein
MCHAKAHVHGRPQPDRILLPPTHAELYLVQLGGQRVAALVAGGAGHSADAHAHGAHVVDQLRCLRLKLQLPGGAAALVVRAAGVGEVAVILGGGDGVNRRGCREAGGWGGWVGRASSGHWWGW